MAESIFSFFAGAGLLDLGFEQNGYNIVMVNEYNNRFMHAYQYARNIQNFRQPIYGYQECSVDEFLSEKNAFLHEKIAIERANGNVVGFIGGPPCPDFSVAGKNLGRNGKNGVLAQSYVDLIINCQPDFFVFENVKGLVKTVVHRQYYEELKIKLTQSGYILKDSVLNALSYGVAQDRERIFLIGIRNGFATGTKYTKEDGEYAFIWDKYALFKDVNAVKKLPWASKQQFIENSKRRWPKELESIYNELAVETWFRRNDVYSHPNGQDVFKVKAGLGKMQTIEEGDVSRKSFKRLHRWRFSPTAAYGNNEVHLHPYLVRRLSVAETMAIQSLPKWFVLPPDMTLTDKFKVIGNGVPVKVSIAIARSLKEIIEDIIGG